MLREVGVRNAKLAQLQTALPGVANRLPLTLGLVRSYTVVHRVCTASIDTVRIGGAPPTAGSQQRPGTRILFGAY